MGIRAFFTRLFGGNRQRWQSPQMYRPTTTLQQYRKLGPAQATDRHPYYPSKSQERKDNEIDLPDIDIDLKPTPRSSSFSTPANDDHYSSYAKHHHSSSQVSAPSSHHSHHSSYDSGSSHSSSSYDSGSSSSCDSGSSSSCDSGGGGGGCD